MDLSKLSIAELTALQARIPEAIAKKKAEEKQSIIDETKAFLASKGFTIDDLLGKTRAPRKGAPRGPVAVKYRHPQNASLTWTGRGRKPAWVAEWLNSGKTIDGLAV
jgi:DNA-binding protein H-NS